MWSVVEDVWIMGHLLLLSLQDIRDRELSFAVLLEFRGKNRIWRWMADTGNGDVVFGRGNCVCAADGMCSVRRCGDPTERKGAAICSFPDGGLYCGEVFAVNRWSRKKGRFVLEAAYLVPMVCLLMVYLVYFTLYAHDCAVCAHTMMEAGMKGIYREEKTSGEMEDLIRQDLQKKLQERLLWMEAPDITVDVNPVRARIRVSGTGPFLRKIRIETERTLYRISPCPALRMKLFLTRKKNGE